VPEPQSAKEWVKCSDYLLNLDLKVKIVHLLGIGYNKSYYDSFTYGWGDNGQVLARRNPPANTANRKMSMPSEEQKDQKC
jgi:hypothetical protein